MDTFDLRWPHGTATLCTDGWRCRIVWRGVRGLGGSIENSALAKGRVADGLLFAPKLLEQLRARGHRDLADEIEVLVPARRAPSNARAEESSSHAAAPGLQEPAASAAPGADPSAVPAAAPVVAPAMESGSWVDQLAGDDGFEICGNRRAKAWLETKANVFVKLPTASGEWVVKFGDGKFEYASAESFKGVLRFMAHKGIMPDDFMAHGGTLLESSNQEVESAVSAWRSAHPQH